MSAPTPSPAAASSGVDSDELSAAQAQADAQRADRAWGLRVYGSVVFSFFLWVALLIVLQRTFS